MSLQQKLINEYKKNQNIKKQILELEKEHKRNLIYKNDLENEITVKQQQIKQEEYRKFKEYQLNLDQEKGVSIKYEEVPKNKLIDNNLLTELNDLKNELENVSYKAKVSYDEWNYLKKSMNTPLMEEIYAKDPQEDKPNPLF